MDDIRFPIGPFQAAPIATHEERAALIKEIPNIAKALRKLVRSLGSEQLDIPYREDGWSARQIVHHLADNDMNAYLRFKRALTEEEPLGATYREDLWAELHDYREVPIEDALDLLELLHRRFMTLLQGLKPEQFSRKLRTLALGSITLDTALQRFVWHNRHHAAQIESLWFRLSWSGSAAICFNASGELLMVMQGKPHEEKRWSVPSGGRETNESYEDCCIREVFEETGYRIQLGAQLLLKHDRIAYFRGEIVGGDRCIQDPDGLIYDIAWKSADEIRELALSFEEDRELLIRFIEERSDAGNET
ncbi:YfiT family bacillithiol transferase [Paenibacillus lignilyticus]|uniref:Metal-dependent hydrolase n=1 Tax=Paenibacillus lignilyticus TaxID=1172615 RepID=A0ABS5C7N9_9BACL|nr:putative metal-dependent hydrolase [Paenibacillus lignilyticus]